MKKLLPRLLAFLLVITMLPISAFASLQNHNVHDVTIVQSDDQNNYYFPDIVMLPDGRLIACFYKAAAHVADGSYGIIWLSESTDNGHTWSEPWKVIDRSSQHLDSRDPNLAVLPDGTLVLTYFGGGDTFMLFSPDGGRTWSEQLSYESDILDISISKRGTIAVIDNDNMLVPCYGKSSGNNAYGAPATATGKNQFNNSWQVDAVVLHFQRQNGEWKIVWESMIGQSVDETAVLYTGKGNMDGILYDGDVWTFSREDGSVRVSHDCCRTWEVVAKEEPRQYTTSGTILHAEQIIQPRFVKISDDCWFVTYANYSNLNYAYDRVSRPVYGKVFFPEAGWYATQSKLIYDAVGFGVSDMADPATVLTADGKLLTIYYNTSTKSVAGTFHDLSDWVELGEGSTGTKYVERPFWDGALSTGKANEDPVTNDPHDPGFYFAGKGGWSWSDAGVSVSGYDRTITSKETITGDYSVQFNFRLDGASSGKDYEDYDEGIIVYPVYNSTNPNVDSGYSYRLRLSTTQGAQFVYNSNYNGDSGVIGGWDRSTNSAKGTLPNTFEKGKTYTAKIAKFGDGVFIKAWAAGEQEPGWQCEYHDDSIDVEGASYNWKFRLRFLNKNESATDTENAYISNMVFNKIISTSIETWNGKFNAENYDGYATAVNTVRWTENGVAFKSDFVGIESKTTTPASYTFQSDVKLEQETVDAKWGGWKYDEGLNIIPQWFGSKDSAHYRIVLSTTRGVEVVQGQGTTAGTCGVALIEGNSLTSLSTDKTYTVMYTIEGTKCYIKVWEKGTTPPAWQYEIDDPEVFGKDTPGVFRAFYRNDATTKEVFLSNMTFSDGNFISYESMWKNALSETETDANFEYNANKAGWNWPDGGYTVMGSVSSISSKTKISGDYTAQFNFKLGGTSTDSSGTDRDEGLLIYPLYNSDNPNIGSGYTYRIRLSTTQGAQLLYNPYYSVTTSGVLGGYDYSTDSQIGTLPGELNPEVLYTLKMSKVGNSLNIKVWEADKKEPKEWQCQHTAASVDVEGSSYSWSFYSRYYNVGTDNEYAFISNASFAKLLPMTTVNEAGFKEEAKWTFATLSDNNMISSGKWSISGGNASISGVRSASLYSRENISGNYNASFRFTLNGNAAGSQDGLWIYPLYETTNAAANRGTHKIRLSASEGIQAFFREDYAGSTDVEIAGVHTENAVTSLQAGTEYAVRLSKAYDTLSVKVWPADEAEPLGWDLVWRDESIGSMVYWKEGSYSYPYDFARYGDLDASGNPYQWQFHLNYKDAQTAGGVTVSDLELSKQVTMELNHTQLTINEGEKPLNVELNTTFYPNIFAQLPTPEGCVQYRSTDGEAEPTAIIHEPGVRIHRANVTGVAAGEDEIIASYPGIVDSEGKVVEVTCDVVVRPANESNEFKGMDEGYMSEVLYEEDFEDVEVFENATINETDKSHTIEDVNYNPMSAFFDHAPFYAMAHNAVLETEDGSNRYLKTYSGSGSAYAGVQFQSKEKLTGDYTFQADVYLTSGSAEFRLNLSDHKGWSQPSGEAKTVRTFGANMTSLEKMEYANYQFGFRQWMTRGRLNSSVGIYLYDEAEKAGGWQTVKAVKAGDTVYFKSWAKGTPEPDWEVIFVDPKIAKADEDFGGAYLTIDFDANYADTKKYSTSGEILMDNVRITRQVEIDDSTEVYNVTLDLGGATLADGKNITEYAAGSIVDLPIAEDMVKDGYIFDGWYDNPDFEGNPMSFIPTDATGDLVLYAKWIVDGTKLDDDAPATGGIDGPTFEPTVDFKDVPASAWYHEAVEYAVLNGLMNGVSETEFAPNNTLNRAMVVTVLWRMEGEPVVNYLMQFEDVPSGQWYTEAVRWAASEGIVNGIDAQTYAPLNAVTREQLVTILWRYAQKKGCDVSVGEDTNILSYMDAFDVAEYAIPAMQWACGAGIINGNDDGTLNPKGNTKRSEFAKVIMNFCENVAE